MIPKPDWRAYEITVLRSFFDLRDADSSKSLSSSELMRVIKDMGREPVEDSEDYALLMLLLKKCDTDNSDSLDFEEFCAFIAEFYQLVYSRIFNEHDADKSGTISKKELRNILRDLQMSGFEARWEEAIACVAKVDNGDGLLDIDEFAAFLGQYRQLEFQ